MHPGRNEGASLARRENSLGATAAGYRRFQHPMRIEIDNAVKPACRLRKVLKKAPAELAPESVHKLRTQARRLEATVHAIEFTHNRRARRMLKHLKPLRQAAGGVRDMDVMMDRLMPVAERMDGDGRETLLRLTEGMAAVREKKAKRLRRLIERRGKWLRRELKRYISRVGEAEPEKLGESMAAPQMLTAQLQHWPKLKADNLHEFRIQAKELRYMLQLAPGMDEHTLRAFARVKDVAGEWHDWLQLHEYAGKVLDRKEDREIVRRLGEIEHEKLVAALAAANAVRHNGWGAH